MTDDCGSPERLCQPNWTPEVERDYRQWVADLYWQRAVEAACPPTCEPERGV